MIWPLTPLFEMVGITFFRISTIKYQHKECVCVGAIFIHNHWCLQTQQEDSLKLIIFLLIHY